MVKPTMAKERPKAIADLVEAELKERLRRSCDPVEAEPKERPRRSPT